MIFNPACETITSKSPPDYYFHYSCPFRQEGSGVMPVKN